MAVKLTKQSLGTLAVSFILSGAVWAQATPTMQTGQVNQVADAGMLNAASQNGFYAGLNYNYAAANWQKVASANGAGKNNSSAINGIFGFRYNSHLAIQAAFWYFTDVDGVLKTGSLERGTASSYALSASMKLIMPLYQSFEVYMKGGFAYRVMSLDGTGGLLSSLFGFGVQYHLNSNLSFDAGYNYLAGDGTFNDAGFGAVPAYHMFSLGIHYNFVM